MGVLSVVSDFSAALEMRFFSPSFRAKPRNLKLLSIALVVFGFCRMVQWGRYLLCQVDWSKAHQTLSRFLARNEVFFSLISTEAERSGAKRRNLPALSIAMRYGWSAVAAVRFLDCARNEVFSPSFRAKPRNLQALLEDHCIPSKIASTDLSPNCGSKACTLVCGR
jgi:hypothetical protein